MKKLWLLLLLALPIQSGLAADELTPEDVATIVALDLMDHIEHKTFERLGKKMIFITKNPRLGKVYLTGLHGAYSEKMVTKENVETIVDALVTDPTVDKGSKEKLRRETLDAILK